jgi:hypothetical protein
MLAPEQITTKQGSFAFCIVLPCCGGTQSLPNSLVLQQAFYFPQFALIEKFFPLEKISIVNLI